MKHFHVIACFLLLLLLGACAHIQKPLCPADRQQLPDCPPMNAIDDLEISRIYERRTWVTPDELPFDPVDVGEMAKIPINNASARIIGPDYDDSIRSLAIKIWLIENARHTVDVMYYIFADDKVGGAVLGALCNAVKRGVDVRMMVDGLGSMRLFHNQLHALQTCQNDAGFMLNSEGQLTVKRARVQVVIFNAISRLQFNRRSHDKLLVVDGAFPEHAYVMTGGRNISRDYYGINDDGTRDPTAFKDLEILLKSNELQGELSVGDVAENYYSLLFLHKYNKRLTSRQLKPGESLKQVATVSYSKRKEHQEALAFIKNQEDVKRNLAEMDKYMLGGFVKTKVHLAHQLGNLTSASVTTNHIDNIRSNPNSIAYLIAKVIDHANHRGGLKGSLKIVSPYLFISKYKDDNDEIIFDGSEEIHKLLKDNPDLNIEMITNSVLTSDNFMTQAIIDVEMMPRLLLGGEMTEQWQSLSAKEELGSELVNSEAWIKKVNRSRLAVYQTGKIDSVLLGGDKNYGKLHAKFIFGDNVGFIGTSNFDYRSNLYNNEAGFVFYSEELSAALQKEFDKIKASSYRWGSKEWLQMRHLLLQADSIKSLYDKTQRSVYKVLDVLHLKYLM